ncbi:gluconokinase [Pedobacter duraquae]|uniref:Gluconate kinase (FGGY family) n=1 Tax=Pedobacter duraquae TaxID=425511 RepID=A0A4R6IL86_9SPHI|nr:gluconokinase [Pedobacter duraquae]TDO22811.1 gluconate kinase (FGGY family) [Pedobacter duraquae]
MTEPYIIGIDVGTGSTKALAIALSGTIHHVTQHSYPTYSERAGMSEQDPEEIWVAFQHCIHDIISHCGKQPVAISISTAMHSIIPVSEDGKALSYLITWADSRSEDIATALRNSPEGPQFYRTSGTPIHAMSPLCKLLWLKKSDPLLFNASSRFISIKAYIWHKLFGEFEEDYAIASATGLFDILELQWSADILDYAGITYLQLPKPVPTYHVRTDIIPEIATQMNLSPGLSVCIGASDGCTANLGTGVVASGTAALTIGTSGAVRITSSHPIYNEESMTFNYILDSNTYVCGGAINNGGLAIDWAIKTLMSVEKTKQSHFDTFFQLASETPAGADGLFFLPYLTGDRAPIWDSSSNGAFIGLKNKHTQQHLFKAVLEGVCYPLCQILNALERNNTAIDKIHVSGGFINSPVWLQTLSDICGKKLYLMQTEDASAIGAAILAARVLFPGDERIELASQVAQAFVVPDVKSHAVYRSRLPLFSRLYSDLKETMHLINDLKN